MTLILNTAQLKSFVDVHKQTNWDTLRLFVEQAEQDYILPLISEGIYNYLSGIVNAPDFNPESFPLPEIGVLYHKLCIALSHYGMYLALPYLNTPVGDQGVVQQSSREGTTVPAAQWRYESRRNSHLNMAESQADRVLDYLEAHADLFLDWKLSPSYTITKDLFIANSSVLSRYLNSQGSRRAYIVMRPWIRLAEKKYIVPAIGHELFSELKQQQLNNNLTELNRGLMGVIQEALAWCCYYEAFPSLQLKITADGFSTRSISDGIVSITSGSDKEKQLAYDSASSNMATFLASLVKYLDGRKALFPLYSGSKAADNHQPHFNLRGNCKSSGHFRV